MYAHALLYYVLYNITIKIYVLEFKSIPELELNIVIINHNVRHF